MGPFFVIAIAALIVYFRRLSSQAPFERIMATGINPGGGEDPRFQVLGFFLEQKGSPSSDGDPEDFDTEIFTEREIPQMVEMAEQRPGTTTIMVDLCDPDTGERFSRQVCKISGDYAHNSNQ